MSIKKVLQIAFGLLCLMIILLLSVSLFSSYKTQESSAQLIHDHELSRSLTEAAINAQAIRRYEKEYFIYIDHEKREKYWGEWSEAQTKIAAILTDLANNVDRYGKAELKVEIIKWQLALNFYTSEFTQLNANVLNGNINTTLDGNAAIQDGKNEFKVLLDGVSEEIENIFTDAKKHADTSRLFNTTSLIVIAVISIISFVIALISLFKIPKSISFPITELTNLTTLISKGKADHQVKVIGSPEIVELSKSVERLRISTNGLMGRYQTSKAQYENLRDKIIAAKNKKAQVNK